MKYEDSIEQLVKEGAVKLHQVSNAWSIAYRIKKGELQGRGIYRSGENDWTLGEHFVGSRDTAQKSGWYPVNQMHAKARLIDSEAAQKNPGYLIEEEEDRQCQTCKNLKPLKAFQRDMVMELGYRTWECNQCAQERHNAKKSFNKSVERRVGDHVERGPYLSRPPAEGEI